MRYYNLNIIGAAIIASFSLFSCSGLAATVDVSIKNCTAGSSDLAVTDNSTGAKYYVDGSTTINTCAGGNTCTFKVNEGVEIKISGGLFQSKSVSIGTSNTNVYCGSLNCTGALDCSTESSVCDICGKIS